MLSVDRLLTAEESWRVQGGKVRRVVEELRREYGRRGVELRDWVSVLEWHADGYPHWHVLMNLSTGSKASMVPLDVVHRVWGDAWVKASRVKSAAHWRELIGYVHKGGYFGKPKAHQATLPAWAQSRRAGSIRKVNGGQGWEPPAARNGRLERAVGWSVRTYAQMVKGCGAATKLLGCGETVTVNLPVEIVRELLLTRGEWCYLDIYAHQEGGRWVLAWPMWVGATVADIGRGLEEVWREMGEAERQRVLWFAVQERDHAGGVAVADQRSERNRGAA